MYIARHSGRRSQHSYRDACRGLCGVNEAVRVATTPRAAAAVKRRRLQLRPRGLCRRAFVEEGNVIHISVPIMIRVQCHARAVVAQDRMLLFGWICL